MGARWKGKDAKAKALAEPMSEIVSALQSSLKTSEAKGVISGSRVLFEANTDQSELLNRACFGRVIITSQKDKEWYELNLQEAFYLAYTLKCLKIAGDDDIVKSHEELWQFMISKVEMFPEFFKAYSHLRMNNWVVKSGSQYGVDYVAYRQHPALVHSEYAVLVLSERNGNSCKRLKLWSDIYGTVRLCGGVAKTLLALHVRRVYETDSLLRLNDYDIEARTISRWIPEQAREKKRDAKSCSETKVE
ncbi:tRNA-splicing endonuclease subunit Sen2-1-like [Amaranthus tricolor]|uniref:tRNA-splicing endonuclease subunit Sen2-1-like n=1 Tax=Amaranthus tricolor TaxID=29722 RepID=UPI002586F4FF|nr:tRNA-splicing endonuclease subunit Sen2-1-like [Amaranthus tricolor]XP_057548381.1 tRNA-splicing endonuclease subunit Sen2-1-like [Amaranthus tricolor]XP_057548382.1 tRNA-splicing endonuclease subunit Sen2-1-like [Amaranthus tricolor]XP_057548383.1 tRNA-splicing endonuclease subunit Sen2-1-like [Amaranthus tricolor]XP_057548384.1 tRNA-splicing endonuclease subunit Sen2-1-like [Amaranthus tricolor]XP_057548385.1 tRNA-splicing endonuclease subunit Sen2-1-like [Amaranthus tricolor]XP_05754838